MRWPAWTDGFRHCFGCCEGPHNQHYDAWLARERLNQVKRLEGRVADLAHENAALASQLGQAVNVLDSYHNFDMDALHNPSLSNDERSETQSRHGSGRMAPTVMRPSSETKSASGKLRTDSLAARNQSFSSARMGPKTGSLQARHVAPPASKPPTLAIPERLLQMGVPANAANHALANLPPVTQRQPAAKTPPQAMARAPMSLRDIPSSEELDNLLRRHAPKQRPTKQNTAPAPTTGMGRTSSAALPPVSTLLHLLPPETIHEEEPPDPAFLSTHSGSSTPSFSFAPLPHVAVTPKVQEKQEAPERPGIMVERSRPVQDGAMLATQARGQIYSGHYTPETSPFAQAAARMPQPGPAPSRPAPTRR